MAVNIQPVPYLVEYNEDVKRFLDILRDKVNELLVNEETHTGAGTIGAGNTIICNSATAFTLNMPILTQDREIIIKNIGAGVVTLDGNLDETIGGNLTFDLCEREDLEVIGHGTDWI